MNRYHAIDDNYLSVYDIETLAAQEDDEAERMAGVGITPQDIDDLRAGGVVAKYWHWRKLFYALKNAILEAYGRFDGYDMQVWQDVGFGDSNYTDEEEVLAEHKHILRRWLLGDSVFHCPTDEFYYFNFQGFQTEKFSKRYFELQGACKNKIEGKRKITFDRVLQESGWQALKRLVARHGNLLRNEKAPD